MTEEDERRASRHAEGEDVAVAPLEATRVRFAGGVTVTLAGLADTVTCIVTSTVGKLVFEPINR